MHWKFPSSLAWRWETQNSPAPVRHGMPCRSACGGTLTGAARCLTLLGAEIRGVDLARPIDDETFAAIERAYDDHAVIFFRDQHITPPQQVAFTRRFGEIEFNIFGERWSVPSSPEIVVVSNVTEDGRPIGVRRAGENWHGDMPTTPQGQHQ